MNASPSNLKSASEQNRERIVARADELYRDLSLGAVREWKALHPGGKAIGYLPVYIPREVVHAAGMLPVGLFGGGEMEIVKGDAYFQSYICHIPRSTIELGLNGTYDVLDGVVFPSICDVIRNLSGMWQILFPGKYVRYFDMPQNFNDAIGGEFYRHELTSFLHDLEQLSGRRVSDADLCRSIEVYNANRRLISALYALRVREPWNVPTSELYLLMRAGNVLPVEDHNELLRGYVAAAQESERPARDMARVALRGCFCEQPPHDLVKALEQSGCYIVDDDWMLGQRWFTRDVPIDGDPIMSLARMFLHASPACPSLYLENGEKGAALVQSAKDTKAEGVIFASASFCDPALLDQPMTMAAVKAASIPCTSFLFAENTGQYQVIREQAGTFADAIKLS